MNAKLSIEKITPQRAAILLENLLEDQRNQRSNYIENLASDMKMGLWRLSCDAILLVKGRLANGQHRMMAVVKSNTPQPFVIMENFALGIIRLNVSARGFNVLI